MRPRRALDSDMETAPDISKTVPRPSPARSPRAHADCEQDLDEEPSLRCREPFPCLNPELASVASLSYGEAMRRRAAAPHQKPVGSGLSSRRSPMSASVLNRWS